MGCLSLRSGSSGEIAASSLMPLSKLVGTVLVEAHRAMLAKPEAVRLA
jgi:hypothetical protein